MEMRLNRIEGVVEGIEVQGEVEDRLGRMIVWFFQMLPDGTKHIVGKFPDVTNPSFIIRWHLNKLAGRMNKNGGYD